MTTINFIKTLKYEIKPKDRDVFEYLSALAMQELNPPSISQSCILTNAKIVFHSPLQRVVDTLGSKKDISYICMDELKEILFDIRELCTRKEWREKKSHIIRQRFKEAFINDQLPVKRIQIFNEIRNVLNNCLTQSVSSDVIIISHSFRLKLIESFINTQGDIIDNSELINKYILNNQKTYKFGGGFSVKREDLEKVRLNQ